jgi:hypothetical protein
VSVSGRLQGTWVLPYNAVQTANALQEHTFLLDPAATQGRPRISVRIDVLSWWNAISVEALSYVSGGDPYAEQQPDEKNSGRVLQPPRPVPDPEREAEEGLDTLDVTSVVPTVYTKEDWGWLQMWNRVRGLDEVLRVSVLSDADLSEQKTKPVLVYRPLRTVSTRAQSTQRDRS